MKKVLLVSLLFLLTIVSFGQDPFVKITDAKFGTSSRIFPTTGNGWMIFSSDTLMLSKFNSCGINEWGKKFATVPIIFGMYDFIQLLNGDYAFMQLIRKGNVTITEVTRLDPNGNIIWSNSYGDNNYNQYIYSLFEDANGNLFVYGNVEHVNLNPLYNVLMKINANGVLQWTKFYDHGGIWGGAIATSDGGFLLRTGDFLIKTNTTGDVIWSLYINSSSYSYLAPIEVSDGYICSAFAQPSNEMLFFKVDKLGNQLWSGGKTLNMNGNPPRLRNHPNGNIVGVFRSGSLTKIIELDKDLVVIKESTLDNTTNLLGVNMNFLKDETPILTGFNTANYLFFARLDKNYKTSCDITSTASIFSYYLANIVISPTNSFNYTLNTVAEIMPVNAFSTTVQTTCIKPKYLDLGLDTAFCKGDTIKLENKIVDKFKSYLWSTGDTTSSIDVSKSGVYFLNVADDCGEFNLSDTIVVSELKSTPVLLGSDIGICENDSIEVTANSCDSCTYLWNTGDTTNYIFINIAGNYKLSFLFTNGCITSDSIVAFQSKCECDIYLPNAFTPNADNKNDFFKPFYFCDLQEYEFTIHNRWGQTIFTSVNSETAWNGKYNNIDVPAGVYAYTLAYTPILKGKKSKSEKKTGTVVLIR